MSRARSCQSQCLCQSGGAVIKCRTVESLDQYHLFFLYRCVVYLSKSMYS
uniref:Uncharacterized protein n=1 Tax=Anguilla anguilla TaxID=7936 RepID=A0A0E9Q2U3_ANGAN